MGKWILAILVILSSIAWSCGGKKLMDSSLGSDDGILFVNETSENTYRILVVGTNVDFNLRAFTEKAVKVPAQADNAPFNINIERTEGSKGYTRFSANARAGQTVRIFLERNSSYGLYDTVVKIEGRSL